MHRTSMLPLVLLTLTACTLNQPLPEDELRGQVQAQAAQLASMQQALVEVQERQTHTAERVSALEPLSARLTILEALQAAQVKAATKGGAKGKPDKPLPVAQLIQQAKDVARVTVEPTGFFGHSGEYTHQWSPGRVLDVPLTASLTTVIAFPPGEVMVAGVLLEKDAFEVKTERVGHEPLAYDVVTIRPKFEQGDVDTFALMESGRRYLLHLMIGKVGLLAVNIEAAPVYRSPRQDKPLILPRPTP